MSSPALTETVIFGVALAFAGGGAMLAWRGHARLCAARDELLQRDALLELIVGLQPLLAELERRLTNGAEDAPDWTRQPLAGTAELPWMRGADPIVFLTHDVERLWTTRLETRISDASVHDAHEEMNRAAVVFSYLDVPSRRPAAENLLTRVRGLRAAAVAAQRGRRLGDRRSHR